ncbi:hypothetical protein CLOM_g22391 [Closterium sp. NIES-68]|nr:hypothetical protein CLOM_g22391 [Closterium sp. NIES-68]GJP77832.1 hypothetical protein CLOP_g8169 [Closterium sp. NIES-67]
MSSSAGGIWPWSPHSRPMAKESRRGVTRVVSLWRKAKNAAVGKGTAAAAAAAANRRNADGATGCADEAASPAVPVANLPCETAPLACDAAEDLLATSQGQGVFQNLSSDCLEIVFCRLGDARDAVRASCVCKAWHNAFHGSTRHVSLQLDPALLQWQPSFHPIYTDLDTVTHRLMDSRGGNGKSGEGAAAADGSRSLSEARNQDCISTVGLSSWWDPLASNGWHVNHPDRFDFNSQARPGWMAHEPYHRSFSPNHIRTLLQQFPNLTSACLPLNMHKADDAKVILSCLPSHSGLRALHLQLSTQPTASRPPQELDLSADLSALLHALPHLRSLHLQSKHSFLRLAPPTLAAFSRLLHLSLPVGQLPPPLLTLTQLTSLNLAVDDSTCSLLLASPAPFQRFTRLSSLWLHLGVSSTSTPRATISSTVSAAVTISSSSRSCSNVTSSSANATMSSTSLAPLLVPPDLFSGLSHSLTSLTFIPPGYPPPSPTSLPPSLFDLSSLRSLRLLPPSTTTAHGWEDLNSLSLLTQLTFLEVSCAAGYAVPVSLHGLPCLAHLVVPWAKSDPGRIIPSLRALRELEIGTGALSVGQGVEAAAVGPAAGAAARAGSTSNPQTTNTPSAASEPPHPTLAATTIPSLLPPALTSLRLLSSGHHPVHLALIACPALRRLSFAFNVELAARVPPSACFFPNLRFLELFRVEGAFGWGNGQWLGAMPRLTHFVSRCPMRNHAYLLQRTAPSLKFLHLEDPSPKVPLVVLPALMSLTIDKYCDVSALLSSLTAFSSLHTLRFNYFSLLATDRKLSPGRVGCPPSLRVLQFRFAQIRGVPAFVRTFTSLERLDVVNCGVLDSWPEYLAEFPAFRCLRVDGCKKLPPCPLSLAPFLAPCTGHMRSSQ